MFQWIRLIAFAMAMLWTNGASAQDKKNDAAERAKLASDRTVSENNLKLIARSFHEHQKVHLSLPRDIMQLRPRKAVLSWRVLILPYMGELDLYKQFNLEEPWDSDHNKKLIDKMPKVYTAPRGKFDKGHTFYQGFAGTGAVMSGKPVRFERIPDGASNTFMVVEAGEAVVWTKPGDIPFDTQKPLPPLGGIFDGAFNAAMCDGSVRFVQKGVKTENLKKYVTLSDGMPGSEDDFKPSK